MTFDDNGNLLTQTDPSGTITYTWDARNRLTGIAGLSMNASFAYDGVGRRARKTVSSVTMDFLYDGRDVLRESSVDGNASYLRTLAIDEALTRTDPVDTAHYLADALGSTVTLTTSAGSPTTTYTYEPYGRTAVEGTAVNPIQYTGRENDGTGLYYYRARYYSPQWQRFMSEDPLGFEAADLNLYAYTSNNPITFGDPLGLEFILFGRWPTIIHRPIQWSRIPSQRPIPQSARPAPRQTADPPVRPSDSPWPPEPVWREPIQHRNPLPSPIDPPCPICPSPPLVSPPPHWPAGPTPTPPLPGAREKSPASSPAPALPPPWA